MLHPSVSPTPTTVYPTRRTLPRWPDKSPAWIGYTSDRSCAMN